MDGGLGFECGENGGSLFMAELLSKLLEIMMGIDNNSSKSSCKNSLRK